MATNSNRDVVELDGRTGEGGGQVVRIALALSAITGIPIRIHHVRGNRPGKRGGGLKAQHATCVSSLAKAANAEVRGGHIGSQTLEFIPSPSPVTLQNRKIKIDTDSAGSSLLVFQSMFPFLLFSADESDSPITVLIRGGTNVSFSLSFEYLDQVLLPTLESLGVPVIERHIAGRGWSHGSKQIGDLEFTFKPIPIGQSLEASNWPKLDTQPSIKKIDITLVVPEDLRKHLRDELALRCERVFPNTEIKVIVDEDSRHKARIYTLLVAHSETGFRFGKDWLYDRKVTLPSDQLAVEISNKLVNELDKEIQSGRGLDEYLQDQLIIFQALAKGVSSINGDPRVVRSLQQYDWKSTSKSGSQGETSRPMKVKETSVPFGDGSMHTKTARWVVSQMLPEVRWYDDGKICEGVGWASKAPESLTES